MTSNPTVLIVDDEVMGQKALEALLLGHGYTLVFATNGEEAVRKTLEIRPDLILLDVMMPGMDGFAVCRQLRANSLVAEVPIIMVTALDDQASRLQGIEAGADDFITKPFNRTELRARVSTITRLNRYRRLYEHSMQFTWVVDRAEDGYVRLDATGQIDFMNPKARLYLELTTEDTSLIREDFLTLVRRLYQCVPPELWLNWPLLRAEEQSRPRYLIRPETPELAALWLEVAVLNFPGQPDARHGCLVRLHDVTSLITNQIDTRNFYSAVSHKLRTPLIYVISGLELLMEQYQELSAGGIEEFLAIALRGGHNLQKAVNDVLDYGQISSLARLGDFFTLGQLPTILADMKKTLNIPDLVFDEPEVLQNTRIALPRQGVEVILWELLENASKFHPTHAPRVEIEVSRPQSGFIRLLFRDNGVHLPPEQLLNAWVPYFQGEKYFTGQVPGMGLGLATVATLVWNAGGTYQLHNRTDGDGVVVELTLPER
ncbi:MAG: response regulator [Chloroflexi bacterium]|nr:response regulator [Chloroflexota bacterium]MBP8058860.1 response regulator [Chloroflexota bacterium]